MYVCVCEIGIRLLVYFQNMCCLLFYLHTLSKSICIHFLGGQNFLGFRKWLFLSPVIFLAPNIYVHLLFPHFQDQKKKILTIYDNYFTDLIGVLITCPVLSLRTASSEDKRQVAVGKSEQCQCPRLRSCSLFPYLYTNCLSLSLSWEWSSSA